MSATSPFARYFVRFVALPLLFIAGIQLYILSEQTEVYFAWTIAVPFTAAFLGAGYWAAMVFAYRNWWESPTVSARTTGLTALAATGVLGIATFLHLDKFHLASPALFTRFVTWVWILVYALTPFLFIWIWLALGRSKDETIGSKPLPAWVRYGNFYQALVFIPAALLLFLAPASLIPSWPWELTPLTARAISAWLLAYGLACVTITLENNTSNTLSSRLSLFAFCILQMITLARYFTSFDLSKPLAWVYLSVLIVGAVTNVSALFSRQKD